MAKTTKEKFWTQERMERCEKLWADGYSALEIGAELGCSRNATIAKIHRAGWRSPNSWDATKQATKEQRARRRLAQKTATMAKATAARAAKAAAEARIRAMADGPPVEPTAAWLRPPEACVSFAEGGPKGLLELRTNDCRFPITDGPSGHLFCAAPVAFENQFAGGMPAPYCRIHFRLSYQPPEPRRRRINAL